MILRPEDGEWKVVHLQEDPITSPQPAESVIQEQIHLKANFHEKAHFVKADVAAPLWSSATALCPSLCFHPHSQ